jgi:integrase
MGTIRKVEGKLGDRWRVELCVGGVRDSDTFANPGDAKQWMREREAELGRGAKVALRRTLADALERYAAEVSPQHEGARWEQIRLAKIGREFDAVAKPLRDLTAEDFNTWRDKRLREVSESSVAREFGLLRTVLKHACSQWRYLTREKLAEIKESKKPKGGHARTTRMPDKARVAILDALGYSEDEPVRSVGQRVGLTLLIALETAMRTGELCKITRERLHLGERYVHLPKTKNGDARDVPLSAEAVRLFKRAPGLAAVKASAEPEKRGRGRPPKSAAATGNVLGIKASQVDANYRKARDTTEHTDIHFHDSRAEALTRLAKKVDVLTLARIVGHRDPRSLMIYYRPTVAEIADRL